MVSPPSIFQTSSSLPVHRPRPTARKRKAQGTFRPGFPSFEQAFMTHSWPAKGVTMIGEGVDARGQPAIVVGVKNAKDLAGIFRTR